MTIAKGMLKVKSGDTFVQFHPETSSDMVTGFRDSVRENLPISVYSSNTAYAVNDCAFFEELPKWAYLRCTKGGTTGAVVPSAFTKSATLDQVINDGSVTWVVCKHGVPIDAKLKSIIANTITADSLLYGTGANTFGITALSALARTLIGKANAADMRSTLGAAAASHSHSVGDITNFASKVIEAIGDQTLSALGVRYSITTNGYICFGDLFGGLILQWGDTSKFTLPNGADANKAFYIGHLDNAGAHNALYRGCDITAYFNSGAMSTAIATGTFENIYPGDYIIKSITVDGTTYSNVKWVVGDLDYHLHRGDTETTRHHVLMFPEGILGAARMNPTNDTTGGYKASEMWTTTIPKYAAGIQSAFGSSHVLSHRELLTNAKSDVASGGYSGWTGASSGWEWVTVLANLFNENMVYGSRCFGSSGYDIGDCNTQVAAMRHNKSLSFSRAGWCWLRSVAGSADFAYAHITGDAGSYYASYTGGRVRPYFLLT